MNHSKNTLKHLTAPRFDEVVAAVHEHGAVIIDGLLGADVVARVRGEVEPLVAAAPFGSGLGGSQTQRSGGLVRSAPASRQLVMHDTIIAAADAYLGPWSRKILLHLTQAIYLHPGQPAQIIHRDRLGWGKHLPPTIEPEFSTIWALTDFTSDNGATRVVPGSHRWAPGREPQEDEIAAAEMSAGSVLVYSGSVLHGGGENRSAACRLGLNIAYCLSWLRQEENQYLSCPPDFARDLDPALQDLLGYTMSDFGLGCFSTKEGVISPPAAAVGRVTKAASASLEAYVANANRAD